MVSREELYGDIISRIKSRYNDNIIVSVIGDEINITNTENNKSEDIRMIYRKYIMGDITMEFIMRSIYRKIDRMMKED